MTLVAKSIFGFISANFGSVDLRAWMCVCVSVFVRVVGEVWCNCFPVCFLFPCLHCVWALLQYMLPSYWAFGIEEQTLFSLLKRTRQIIKDMSKSNNWSQVYSAKKDKTLWTVSLYMYTDLQLRKTQQYVRELKAMIPILMVAFRGDNNWYLR